jgi:hypothetical protein
MSTANTDSEMSFFLHGGFAALDDTLKQKIPIVFIHSETNTQFNS